MKAFDLIPTMEIDFPSKMSRDNPKDSNPFEVHAKIHSAVESPIYRFKIKNMHGEITESIWINDAKAGELILNDTKTWLKGPQTFEPFLSLVPLHLIGIEGDLHVKMRTNAQRALNQAVDEFLPQIATKAANKLVTLLQNIGNGTVKNHWMVNEVKNKTITSTCVDKMMRATTLEIISEALFGESWNSIDDYSNGKPDVRYY